MEETERRRAIQLAYNEEHGIVPRTVTKSREEIMSGTVIAEEKGDETGRKAWYAGPDESVAVADPVVRYLTDDQKRDLVAQMRSEMIGAAEKLDFERAAELRDSIAQLETALRLGR
jgi:excinuclease ABC subunit B